MSETNPQNLKNHARLDPTFHIVLSLVLVANLVFAIFHLVHNWQIHRISSAWFLFLSIVVFIPVFKLRLYPLKVQDRVIRLEERLRLQALAPAEWHSADLPAERRPADRVAVCRRRRGGGAGQAGA